MLNINKFCWLILLIKVILMRMKNVFVLVGMRFLRVGLVKLRRLNRVFV